MMAQYSNAQPIETVYTYSEWEKIYNRRKAQKHYFIKQKLLGIVVLCTVAAEFILAYEKIIDECGAFLFMLPIGLYLLFTKKKICNF